MSSPVKDRRREAERAIAGVVIKDALAAGFLLNVNNGGDGPELPEPTADAAAIEAAMFATSDEHLLFFVDRGGVKPAYHGWVWFVYGNGGYDVIADNTLNVQDVLKGAEEEARKWEDP